MSNAEYIRETCLAYIRAVNMGLAGDYWRFQLHNKLLEHTHLDDKWLKCLLSNLDEAIGYSHDAFHSRERLYGERLFQLIREQCKRKVEELLSEEDKRFLIRQGFDDWVECWSENMEFNGGCPVLRQEGENE